MAHPCLHIQAGCPPENHIFLSTSYRDNWSLTFPSGLKTAVLDHSKDQQDGRGAAAATVSVPHERPPDLLLHPLRDQRHSWTNCTGSVKCQMLMMTNL